MSTTATEYEFKVCIYAGGLTSQDFTFKAGDEVEVFQAERLVAPSVTTVKRVTHKGRRVELANGQVFNQKNRQVGADYYRSATLTTAQWARDLAEKVTKQKEFNDRMCRAWDRIESLFRRRNGKYEPLTDEQKTELIVLIQSL